MISKNQIKLVRSLEHKKHRQAEGLFVAEGPKVVGDLLACHFRPRLIFALKPGSPPQCPPAATTTGERRQGLTASPHLKEREAYTDFADRCISVTEDELRRLSFLQHPQQVLAVFELPSPSPPIGNGSGGKALALALDGVQDPGNLGTIIRIADWYGIGTVYCSPDSADAWSPKVVQATMGSIARVHILCCDLEKLLREATVPVYGTVLDGDNIYGQQLAPEGIIVMGNEGKGISQPLRRLLTHRLLIPPARAGAESLNVAVATAIVCSEFRRNEIGGVKS